MNVMFDHRPDWNALTREQRIEMVQPLVLEGLSSTKIAARFRNVSRNSIIGLCHRHKWQLKGGVGRKPNEIANAKARAARPHGNKGQPKINAILARAARKPPTPPPTPIDDEVDVGVDVSHLVGIMDLNDSRCRWPMGPETGSAQKFCGVRKSRHAGPYCPEHTRRSEYQR